MASPAAYCSAPRRPTPPRSSVSAPSASPALPCSSTLPRWRQHQVVVDGRTSCGRRDERGVYGNLLAEGSVLRNTAKAARGAPRPAPARSLSEFADALNRLMGLEVIGVFGTRRLLFPMRLPALLLLSAALSLGQAGCDATPTPTTAADGAESPATRPAPPPTFTPTLAPTPGVERPDPSHTTPTPQPTATPDEVSPMAFPAALMALPLHQDPGGVAGSDGNGADRPHARKHGPSPSTCTAPSRRKKATSSTPPTASPWPSP